MESSFDSVLSEGHDNEGLQHQHQGRRNKEGARFPGGVFAPHSTSVVGASIVTHDSIATVTDRLYRNEKKAVVKKTANDALLSSLPTDSLRWIKKRRKINSSEKVALTHFRERQLREIFRGLDFDEMGTIHLDLVKGAANYAEVKLKPKRGKAVFTNIQDLFASMDGDGDGTVDFQELVNALCGSTKSAMDNATEQDVEMLTRRFIEYADIRRRERAVAGVGLPLSLVHAINEEKCRAPTPLDACTGLPLLCETPPDFARYAHFRTLFSIGAPVTEGETVESIHSVVEKAQRLMASTASSDNKTPKERMLDGFYGEMARLRTEELSDELGETPSLLEARLARERDIEAVQKKVREARLKTDDESRRDPEVRELYNRIREEKRYLLEMKRAPWLPPVIASAVVGKPTIVPPLQSPAKRQVHAKLRAIADFVAARPNSPETRNGVRSAKSVASFHPASSRSVANRSLQSSNSSKIFFSPTTFPRQYI